MKFLSFVLVFFLVVAAAARFHAEAEVRESAREIAALNQRAAELETYIERAELDVEVLESASRLSKLNSAHLALGTVRAEQLLDDDGFAEVIGMPTKNTDEKKLPEGSDVIGNAIGMADPSLLPLEGRR